MLRNRTAKFHFVPHLHKEIEECGGEVCFVLRTSIRLPSLFFWKTANWQTDSFPDVPLPVPPKVNRNEIPAPQETEMDGLDRISQQKLGLERLERR